MTTRAVGLWHHLLFNHCPPIPESMIPACEAAIDACVDEEPERLIDMPAEIQWRGQGQAPAGAIVEFAHLEGFVEMALAPEEDGDE